MIINRTVSVGFHGNFHRLHWFGPLNKTGMLKANLKEINFLKKESECMDFYGDFSFFVKVAKSKQHSSHLLNDLNSQKETCLN